MIYGHLPNDLKKLTQLMFKHATDIICVLFFASLMFIQPAHAERLKD